MKDNFDLKKYLVENKVTIQSKQVNEGFMDMFSKDEKDPTDPFPTFQGTTMNEFIKWAVPIFKANNVAKEDYTYWFNQFDNGISSDYKGMTEKELMNVHFGAWFPEYRTESPTDEPYDVQIKKNRY